VFGVDLVREQLRIAGGEAMRVHAGVLHPRGHAIECRITAEDPFNDFLPAAGVVEYLRVPGGAGVRWDGGVEAGNEVSLFYDPLLAKLVVWGETREAAITRMRRALRELVIVGLPTAQAFHLRVMDDPEFQRGEVDITYRDRAGRRLARVTPPDDYARAVAVAAALLADDRRTAARPVPPTGAATGPDGGEWLRAARREGVRG
jgi:acetyl/propionyl-CoA carboxylase alpha subunit